MDVLDWIAARERAALRRVRLTGIGLALVFCIATAWLGWREAGVSRLPGWTHQAGTAFTEIDAILRLKLISKVAHLAKVRGNTFLYSIIGNSEQSQVCQTKGLDTTLQEMPACASAWENALRRIWAVAFGQGGPPIPAELFRDPWGSPYVLDYSEVLCGSYGSWCPHDVASSAGPDGKVATPDDIDETLPQHLGPGRIANQPQASSSRQ